MWKDDTVKVKDVWRQEKKLYKRCACKVSRKKEGKTFFFLKKKMLTKIGVPLRPFYGAISFLER